MNQDAIVVALDFIKGQILELKTDVKGQILELKTDIKGISDSQGSLEDEIRKGYVTKEQHEELKLKINEIEKDYRELKTVVVKITTGISIFVGVGLWIVEHFFIK
jgi:archaellum component FlaC